jgi:hypothetical protein
MKTIARVYDTYGQARRVVDDLEASGIASSEINLIANKYVCDESARIQQPSAAGPGAGVGAALGGTAGLLAGLGIIAIPGLGPVVAAGALAATAVGAVAGAATGGVVGALVSAGVPEHEAHVYCEAVRRGGTMVSVRVADDQAAIVQRMMDRHEPIDPVERRTIYTGEGWKRFDPAAAPYTPSQAEIERLRRPYVS